jgi:DNA-3-methyladenine glycosylase II
MRTSFAVAGPWSLATSREFWEGFRPAPLAGQPVEAELRAEFLVEEDWSRATATIRQDGATAHVTVTGDGDLAAAAEQTARFLAIDVDGRGWPAVGERDPVIGEIQRQLPGLRPCGFYSPYEAAAWAVLTQRVRMTQAAATRADLVRRHGGFPAPALLRTLDLDLFGRQTEYLHAVAEAALDGVLDGGELRKLDAAEAIGRVRQVKGLGAFAAELVVIRGANHPDAVPQHEPRLMREITRRYGSDVTLAELSEVWRPYRGWASVHLRASA